MRAEEVGRILRKRVRTTSTHRDWKSYVSIFSYEDVIPTVIKDNPLIVVHPGWKMWEEMREDEEGEQPNNYKRYLERVRRNVKDFIRKGRTVLVYTPSDQRKETLDAIGTSKNVILIPTEDGNPLIDRDILGITDSTFYRKLSQYVRRAKVCGEYFANESGTACVDMVEERLHKKYVEIKTTRGPVYG